ncbi:tyrosine-type recombinase/integrase [Neisseria lactamica]|uniref:tyrosine-type recombinase/integrase n=1 Tax=Neisseria lactamica TaxID=486 RepID=UPI001EFD35FD|nr:site-specific integrase [Neisseria lactamica]
MAGARLTDRRARAVKAGDGAISHGGVGGLCLNPSTKHDGQGSWVLSYTDPLTQKRMRDTIGRYPAMSIAEAGRIGAEIKALVQSGVSPRKEQERKLEEARRAEKNTFEAVGRMFFAEKRKDGAWRNDGAVTRNIRRMERYVYPLIGGLPIAELKAADIAAALKTPIQPVMRGQRIATPLNQCKGVAFDSPGTAEKITAVIGQIFTYAEAMGLRDNGNPIGAVKLLLKKGQHVQGVERHQPSLPFEHIPKFVKTLLEEVGGDAKNALLVQLLIAARSGAVSRMKVEDVRFEEGYWRLPAFSELSKTSSDVLYPLTPRLKKLLAERKEKARGGYLFEGKGLRDNPVSNTAINSVIRRMAATGRHRGWLVSDEAGKLPVPHGFRATFRAWATTNGYEERLIERQLAHVFGSVRRTYDREHLIKERLQMMTAWEDFFFGGRKMNVGGYRLQEPDFLEEDKSGSDGAHTVGELLCAVKTAADEERRGGGRRTDNEARGAVYETARLVLEEVGTDNLKEAALNQAIDAEDAQGRLIGILAYAMLSGERFRRETLDALGLTAGADRRDTLKRHKEIFIAGYARVFFDILEGWTLQAENPIITAYRIPR